MDGMFGGAFGQAGGPATGFNYFPGNGDYSTWGNSAAMSRKPHYDDYYRHGDPMYAGMFHLSYYIKSTLKKKIIIIF